jgi:hypothetical protein
MALSFLGRSAAATAAYETGVALSMRHPFLVAELGVIRAAAGDETEAMQLRDELLARSRTTYISPLALGAIPLALGDVEEGFRYWKIAFDRREPGVISTTMWPTYAKLRQDPRVQRLMFEEMGVTWLT